MPMAFKISFDMACSRCGASTDTLLPFISSTLLIPEPFRVEHAGADTQQQRLQEVLIKGIDAFDRLVGSVIHRKAEL